MTDFGDPRDPLDGFDPFDAELGARLRSLGGTPSIDPTETLSGLRPALQRARVRRRVAAATTSAAFALGVGGIAAALTGNGASLGNNRITVAPAEGASSTRPDGTLEGRQESTTAAGQPTPPGSPNTGGTGPGASTPGTSTPGSSNSGPSSHGSSTTGSSSTTPTTGGSSSTSTEGSTTSSGPTTTTGNGSTTQTFTGVGGSVTITWDSTTITSRSYSAAGGYTVVVRYDLVNRYEVRFDNGPRRTDIKLLVKNGALQPQIIEA